MHRPIVAALAATCLIGILGACDGPAEDASMSAAPAAPQVALEETGENIGARVPLPDTPVAAGATGGAARPRTPPTSAGADPRSPAPTTARAEPGPARQAGAAAAAPPPQTPADAAEVLRRAEAAYEEIRTMTAEFTQRLTVPLLDSTRRSRGTLMVRRPNRLAMKFTDPAGDLVVADGSYLWMYYPSTDPKQVLRTGLAQGGEQVDLQKEFLSNPEAKYRVSLTGSESVGGRPAKILTLVPRGDSPYRRVRIWVDDRDGLVRRFETHEQNESVRVLELSNIRTNVTLPENAFEFRVPAGAEVFTQ